MSANFVKGYNVKLSDAKVVKIDANDRIAKRLEELATHMQDEEPEAIEEGFSEGLDAEMVERLVSDREEDEESSSVIHENSALSAAQAQAMIDEAKENAEAIIEDAKKEAESVTEDARQKGHAEGFEAGRLEGERAGLEKYEKLQSELEKERQRLQKEYEEKSRALEPLLIDKLSDIFTKVTGVRLEDDKDTIAYLLKRVLTNLDGSRNYIVHVSAADYVNVQLIKENIAKGTGIMPDRFEVIEDATLKPNDCLIESDGGIWDCGLGTQMDLLEKQLRILSYEP